jgi:hypothetical protein
MGYIMGKSVKRRSPASVQTALRLPAEMYEKLKQSKLGVSEAIRWRLFLSFELDRYDDSSRHLAGAVLWMARQVKLDSGTAWHQNAKARETLIAAFQAYLSMTETPPNIPDDQFVDDPPTLGRAIARQYISTGRLRERVEAVAEGNRAAMDEIKAEREWLEAQMSKEEQRQTKTKGGRKP